MILGAVLQLMCWWFSYFTAGCKHLLMECQETRIQSRKNKTAFISQLAETSFELKDSSTLGLGAVEREWQCRFTDKKSILQTQRRRFVHSHSVLSQLCSFCLHLQLNSSHSSKHLSWVTVWKWSYCLLLCPVERLIDKWAIAKKHLFFPQLFKDHSKSIQHWLALKREIKM